jgi:hypothetical protein
VSRGDALFPGLSPGGGKGAHVIGSGIEVQEPSLSHRERDRGRGQNARLISKKHGPPPEIIV